MAAKGAKAAKDGTGRPPQLRHRSAFLAPLAAGSSDAPSALSQPPEPGCSGRLLQHSMSDRRIRTLLRQAQHAPPVERANLLLALARAGQLAPDALRSAALLRDPAARIATQALWPRQPLPNFYMLGVHLADLAGSPGITTLDLERRGILTIPAARDLSSLPDLLELSLEQCAINTVNALRKLRPPALRHLDLGELWSNRNAELIGAEELEALACRATLETLRLGHTHLDDVSCLHAYQRLEHLELSRSPRLTDDGLLALQHLPRLRHLDLAFCSKLTSDGLAAALTPLSELTHLCLAGCDGARRSALAAASSLGALSYLDLRWSRKLNDTDLKGFVGHPSLSELVLSECVNLTDACLDTFDHLPSLRKLTVRGCRFTPRVWIEWSERRDVELRWGSPT